MSRKNDAESIDVIVNKIGFAFGEDEILMGGSADQTLPFKLRYRGQKTKVRPCSILNTRTINIGVPIKLKTHKRYVTWVKK